MRKNELLKIAFWVLWVVGSMPTYAQTSTKPFKGYTESTPSKAVYFDWINRNWYGSNERKIEANLKFFKWLHDEYGMQLDIYLMDAGDIDQGPNCAQTFGLPAYGSLETTYFKTRFPHGFEPLVKLASSFNCRLGIWLGPDGYGSSLAEAQKRKDMLVKFCRDYNFALFKFDACCSDLTNDNQKHFIETLQQCRSFVPDLIVLNHRITLNEEARKLTTTFLWEGRETCVDVNIQNDTVAPHHREGNLSRGLPPHLMRLTEDHGVCLSTALENWDDDLVLQAFNRNLILSPEIYGSPFLLSDEMYPKLARLYNIHRKYNDILVHGKMLPENPYGMNAVSRGDSTTRLITLRNLSWETLSVPLKLDETTGILKPGKIYVKQYHPTERFLGEYAFGDEVTVSVLPFRSALIKISELPEDEFTIRGCDFQVVKDLPGEPVEVTLLGGSGTETEITISGNRKFTKALMGGKEYPLKQASLKIAFPGEKQKLNYLQKLGDMHVVSVPVNSLQIIEKSYFVADNNALEVRELLKSGSSKIPAVEQCRNQFFKDTLFATLGLWDKFAFDGDTSTFFNVRRFKYLDLKENTGAFRLDLGKIQTVDSLVFKSVPREYYPGKVEVSENLKKWTRVNGDYLQGTLTIKNLTDMKFRFVRLEHSPSQLSEIEGYLKNHPVERQGWKASNLFGYPAGQAIYSWSLDTKIEGIGKSARLVVTVPSAIKENTVFAAIVTENTIISATDRAPSFPYNNWEHYGVAEKNLTFYIPCPSSLEGKKVTVMLLSTDSSLKDIKPVVWMYNADIYEKVNLVLK